MEIKPSIVCKFSDFILAMYGESDVNEAVKNAAYNDGLSIGTSNDFATEEDLNKNLDKCAVLQFEDIEWNGIYEVTVQIENQTYLCDCADIQAVINKLFNIK